MSHPVRWNRNGEFFATFVWTTRSIGNKAEGVAMRLGGCLESVKCNVDRLVIYVGWQPIAASGFSSKLK